MKRWVASQLLAWKDSPRRKPLILRGARQVGKTWLVENVLAGAFDRFVKIDLEKRRDLHAYFDGSLEPQTLLKYLELASGRIVPGETLLFFDEIQACPRAIMALRYFYEQMPDLHIVAAGSLLEFAFGEISVPVGRLQYLHVHPMTFYEYLLAMGKEPAADYSLSSPEAVPEAIQSTILDELRNYFFVGGMPEAVRSYRDTEVHGVGFPGPIGNYRILSAMTSPSIKPSTDPACLDAVFLKCRQKNRGTD